jgi:hypothetical protein
MAAYGVVADTALLQKIEQHQHPLITPPGEEVLVSLEDRL